jgi:hypothetical protein
MKIFLEILMKLRLMSTLFVLIGFFLGAPTFALAQGADPAVKKSDSGICHDKTSSSYGATKKFEAFPNLEACLKSGGRVPANAAAPEVVVVKKSDSGICHDKSSPSFEKTQKFTAFKTVEECVKSGGTLPKK